MNFRKHYFWTEGVKLPNDMRVFNSGRLEGKLKTNLILKEYHQEEKPSDKPEGLWYGFGSSWIDWCSTEMPKWCGKIITKYLIPINLTF